MGDQINPRIVGATIIGFALVAGAYVTSNFNTPPTASQPAAVVASEAPARVAIPVIDSDRNGIEDWRDTFVTTEITLPEFNSSAPYEPPDTVTGQTGIQLMEDVISSKLYGSHIGPTNEEAVDRAVDKLYRDAEVELFELSDLDLMSEWDDEDIINYANTLASVIIRNSIPGMDDEVTIFDDIVSNQNYERISELEIIRDVYKNYRDESILIPVPAPFAITHLNLMNTYQAIYEDINGMTKFQTDPLLSLVHTKRYMRDAQALNLALQNVLGDLIEQEVTFEQEDPALLFAAFDPELQN